MSTVAAPESTPSTRANTSKMFAKPQVWVSRLFRKVSSPAGITQPDKAEFIRRDLERRLLEDIAELEERLATIAQEVKESTQAEVKARDAAYARFQARRAEALRQAEISRTKISRHSSMDRSFSELSLETIEEEQPSSESSSSAQEDSDSLSDDQSCASDARPAVSAPEAIAQPLSAPVSDATPEHSQDCVAGDWTSAVFSSSDEESRDSASTVSELSDLSDLSGLSDLTLDGHFDSTYYNAPCDVPIAEPVAALCRTASWASSSSSADFFCDDDDDDDA